MVNHQLSTARGALHGLSHGWRAMFPTSMWEISSEPDQALAAVLRQLRVEHGTSQEALGHVARVTAGSLSRIELGQAGPAWTTVRNLAAALDVKLVDLAKAIEAEEGERH